MSLARSRRKAKPGRRPRKQHLVSAAVPAAAWPAWTDAPLSAVLVALAPTPRPKGGR